MGFFNKIFVQENINNELTDITTLDKEHYESFLDAMQKLNVMYTQASKKKTKCLSCKYYMDIKYTDSILSTDKVYCLKLKSDLGNAKVVIECNQFKPIK